MVASEVGAKKGARSLWILGIVPKDQRVGFRVERHMAGEIDSQLHRKQTSLLIGPARTQCQAAFSSDESTVLFRALGLGRWTNGRIVEEQW